MLFWPVFPAATFSTSCSHWVRMRRVISVFFSITGALQLFDVIIPLTNGGPSNSSHTIVSFLYAFGILRMKIGFGAAVSVLLCIACVVVALVYRRVLFKSEID